MILKDYCVNHLLALQAIRESGPCALQNYFFVQIGIQLKLGIGIPGLSPVCDYSNRKSMCLVYS